MLHRLSQGATQMENDIQAPIAEHLWMPFLLYFFSLFARTDCVLASVVHFVKTTHLLQQVKLGKAKPRYSSMRTPSVVSIRIN